MVHASRTGDELHVGQQRFLSTGPVPGDATRWLVPLRVSCSSAPGAAGNPAWDAVLSGTTGKATLPCGAAWAKLNASQAGFYRVSYDGPMAAALAEAAPALPTADRCGLVGDAFALAAAGYAPTAAALALLARLGPEEREYVVWANAAAGLSAVHSVFFEQPKTVTARLEAFARALYARLAARAGWAPSAPGESHLDALLRSLAVGRAAQLGDAGSLASARERFARFAAGDADALPPDLRAGAFKAVVARGGRAEFEAVMKIYADAEQQELRVAALQALGASPDAALVRRALEFNLHGGGVRSQDLMYIVASAAANPAGRRVAWEYLREQWVPIKARLDGGGFLLTRLVSLSTASLASDADAADVEAFFAVHGTPGTVRTVAQSVEKVRAAAAWLRRDANAVAEWLAAQPELGGGEQ
jgi:aminopeptidase 2